MKNKIIEILKDMDVKPSYAPTIAKGDTTPMVTRLNHIGEFRKQIATRIDSLYSGVREIDKEKLKLDLYRNIIANSYTMNGGPDGNTHKIHEAELEEALDFAISRIQSHPTPKISEEEIKTAASEYEKIACCEKDHPWLKEYVNEDFEAGAKWALSKGAKPVNEWISVEDRLPKIYDDDKQLHTLSSDYVMTIKPNGVCTINQLFIRGKDKYCWKSFNKQITHWMPLPEPPNELNK